MQADEDTLWNHWLDLFDKLENPFLEVSPWLFPTLLSAAGLCRAVATTSTYRSLNRAELRVDVALRTGWYLAMMILPWSGHALGFWADRIGDNVVCEWFSTWDTPWGLPVEVPSSANLAWLYPVGHNLWWLGPYLITLVTVSCVPRAHRTGRNRQFMEHGLSLTIGTLILLIVVLSFSQWFGVLFCILVEMATQQPHRPPIEEWPTRFIPAAVESVCFFSALSLVLCLASVVVAKTRHLFAAQRTVYMIAVVLTVTAATLMWYIEDQLICVVSPAVGEQVFVHNLSTRIIPLFLMSPGFLVTAWSQTCNARAPTKEADSCQHIVVPQSTSPTIATAEMFVFVALGVAVLLQAALELKTVVTSYGDPFRFFAWMLATLACLRVVLRRLPFNIGRAYREPVKFYSHLSMCTLLWNTVLVTVQCIVVALALQWLIGMSLLSPVS